MRLSVRFIKSLAILSLGIFVGAKWFSAPEHSKSNKKSIIDRTGEANAVDFAKATDAGAERSSSSRGPASVPSVTSVAMNGVQTGPIHPAFEGLEKAQNYLKLRAIERAVEKEFLETYLYSQFVLPRDDMDWDLSRKAMDQKSGKLENISKFWIAHFTLMANGKAISATAKMEVGGFRSFEEGRRIRQCGSAMLDLEIDGNLTRIPLNGDCGRPAAGFDERIYTWTDTMSVESLKDQFVYLMIPLPEEGGPAQFLESKSLKWLSTGEIRWEAASEVDFKR